MEVTHLSATSTQIMVVGVTTACDAGVLQHCSSLGTGCQPGGGKNYLDVLKAGEPQSFREKPSCQARREFK